ncbi:hypothetical protein CANCADRAFT_30759 [Tortispora caseinolytica NRRL Y-17796]|uniref:Phosphate transporter n=1 Tax=Tortispora caseinolytica NRRL Y-17796 TaxID=767744 RepID=A0A1E4TLM4_9ASCO|nr:hypothetical protein CANCADRAFT_30759 [Tortispora caseinolytica NRRL Y-17796]
MDSSVEVFPLHQYTYIFALTMIFAFLDAWGIGANDVANSFATSVSSRSLKLYQAMMLATVCEFLGAVLAGARVTTTIKNDILDISQFDSNPFMLMITMSTALVGSSLWLTFATFMGMPVSTTHSIIGGVIGAGIASIGADNVKWGWEGVASVFATWGIAPGVAGGFAAVSFLITKYVVMRRGERAIYWGLALVPIYFLIAGCVLTMVIVWKGAPALNLDDWTAAQTVGCIFGVGGGIFLISLIFFVPYFYQLLVKNDWKLKGHHVFLGPFVLRRPDPGPSPTGETGITDYYKTLKMSKELPTSSEDLENVSASDESLGDKQPSQEAVPTGQPLTGIAKITHHVNEYLSLEKLEESKSKWWHPHHGARLAVYGILRGVRQDIHTAQLRGGKLGGDMAATHARAEVFDNKVEHLYSFLQILTAATTSFAHGSNDVSNAVGPLSAVYAVWSTGTTGKKSDVPIWILAYCAAALVIGLWTYGYHMMCQLGNRLTLHTPSRGFSVEFGGAITIAIATQLGLPVSTTQCITGAIVCVGLCNMDFKAINWRMVAWIYFGWFLTLPIAGLVAGIINGIIINAPNWSYLPPGSP